MTTRTGVSTMPIIGQSPLLGLTPWIIYWLVAGSSDTWVWGGVCALLASVLLGVSIGRRGAEDARRGDLCISRLSLGRLLPGNSLASSLRGTCGVSRRSRAPTAF